MSNQHSNTSKNKNNRADNTQDEMRLSALRLCVRLLDNCGMQLSYID